MFQKLFVSLYCQSSSGPQRHRCYYRGTVWMISVRFMLDNSDCARQDAGTENALSTQSFNIYSHKQFHQLGKKKKKKRQDSYCRIRPSVLASYSAVHWILLLWRKVNIYGSKPAEYTEIPLNSICAVCLQYQIKLCNCGKITLPELFYLSKELGGWGEHLLGRVNVSV